MDSLETTDVAVRLVLTIGAGAMLGVDRSRRGRPAGLRTSILVTLAASLAMMLAHVLLVTEGKIAPPYTSMDPMRLPLGILTGMGFIGGGTILRQGENIQGVTTAATLWLCTVVGLAFGGGFPLLGVVGTLTGILVLWGLRPLEQLLHRDRQAEVDITCGAGGPEEQEVRRRLTEAGFWVRSWSVAIEDRKSSRRYHYQLGWRGAIQDDEPPAVLTTLADLPGVEALHWKE